LEEVQRKFVLPFLNGLQVGFNVFLSDILVEIIPGAPASRD